MAAGFILHCIVSVTLNERSRVLVQSSALCAALSPCCGVTASCAGFASVVAVHLVVSCALAQAYFCVVLISLEWLALLFGAAG